MYPRLALLVLGLVLIATALLAGHSARATSLTPVPLAGAGGDGGFNFYCRPEINGLVATLHSGLPPERCGYGFHYNFWSVWSSSYGWEFGCGASYANCWKYEYV